MEEHHWTGGERAILVSIWEAEDPERKVLDIEICSGIWVYSCVLASRLSSFCQV